jgi:CarD family transcriptional regulator
VAKSRPTVTKAPNKPSRPLARPVRPAKPAAKAPEIAKPAARHAVPAKPPAVAPPPVHAAAPTVKPATPAVPHATPVAPATVVKTPESPKPPAAAAAPHPTPAAHPATTIVALAPGAVAQPVRTPDPKSSAPPSVAPKPAPPRPMQGGMQNGRPMPPSRAAAKEEFFVEGDYVVYPTHGVGKVERIATEDIAGHRLELIHITFEENRMTLRVPVTKARSAGLRKLATRKMFDEAMGVLRGRARIKRTMWSRRAQEYEAKINSGDPIAIAEVVRDLHRNSGQPDQSFSERQIYEAAMDRLAAELAALDQTDKLVASVKLVNFLKTV